jgi:hypothetical protein
MRLTNARVNRIGLGFISRLREDFLVDREK